MTWARSEALSPFIGARRRGGEGVRGVRPAVAREMPVKLAAALVVAPTARKSR